MALFGVFFVSQRQTKCRNSTHRFTCGPRTEAVILIFYSEEESVSLMLTRWSPSTLPEDTKLNALPPHPFSLSLLPARQACSISTLPFSLNNPSFYPPFAPASDPLSGLLHAIIGSSASNVKYIHFALRQPVASWQIALISIRVLFLCVSCIAVIAFYITGTISCDTI